ncbi:MAG: dihydroorotate dehydrogenase [Methanomassiliicoccaceae archaeon]|nr:dihydroorotate dehydrogenase [Methanomassiliicoccaceae archaeon]
MNPLETYIGPLKLKNPGMAASGIMDETGDSMVRMLNSGAGAVVTKSIGSVKRSGHMNPSFIELPYGYVNAMGLPGPGINGFKEEMETATKAGMIIGSIFASSAAEFAELAKKMEIYGASAVELNLSCPHAEGYGMEVGTDADIVHKIVSEVKDSVRIPVFAKLTPNTHILTKIGKTVQEAGGDAVVAINTLKAMVISPEFARPVLSNRFGGLSGPAIKPVGVRAVYDLYRELDIPLIGVGGICSWSDAAEYIMAGASAFQVGSAVVSDINIFEQINNGLTRFMKEFGYSSIKKMAGAAHE